MHLYLLVSPLARGAYFDAHLDVAGHELRAHAPGVEFSVERVGQLDFFSVELPEHALAMVSRLSFVQGAFRVEGADGPRLVPIDLRPDFVLPESFVYGVKYRGKTNELVTQLALGLALRYRRGQGRARTVLDPMAGRGTTLLWALRYGLSGVGIEQEPRALDELHAHVKKQTKLHRVKHRHDNGFVGKKRRDQVGRLVGYELAGQRLRLVAGDSRDAPQLVGGQRFDLIVSDLPYGVQFGDAKRQGLRELVAECAEAWVSCLKEGGAMVLVFNTYRPTRAELTETFTAQGCRVEDFSAPHRMSESIVRDLLVVTKP